MFYGAIRGTIPSLIIRQLFLGLELVSQRPRCSTSSRLESLLGQRRCEQPLCYRGTGRALRALRERVRDGGRPRPPPEGWRSCHFAPSEKHGFRSCLGCTGQSNLRSRGAGGPGPAGGCRCPSAEGTDFSSAPSPSEPNSAVGGLTLT